MRLHEEMQNVLGSVLSPPALLSWLQHQDLAASGHVGTLVLCVNGCGQRYDFETWSCSTRARYFFLVLCSNEHSCTKPRRSRCRQWQKEPVSTVRERGTFTNSLV